MRNIIYFLILPFLINCSGGNDRADAYGNFEADEVFVSSETNGKLISLNLEQGDKVEKGEVIAVVDTMQLYFQKEQLRASMSALQQKLQDIPVQLDVLHQRKDVLDRELKRIKNLYDEGAATQKQVDDLSGESEVLERQILASESQLSTQNRAILAELKPLHWKLQTVEDLIDKSLIRSPISGVVLIKLKSRGEMCMAGQPIVKIADISTLTLRAYISGDQLGEIRLGEEVDVFIDTIDGDLKPYAGKLTWVSDKAEFTPKAIQTRSERVNLVYAVKVKVKNDGSLKIGMPAEIVFAK